MAKLIEFRKVRGRNFGADCTSSRNETSSRCNIKRQDLRERNTVTTIIQCEALPRDIFIFIRYTRLYKIT